ncbi:MAG TPA: hypothetical protein VMX57_08600 [Planctomycetota bacterium]|nr:hypothetical protein [Planctomycetota bacterium]
MDERNRTRTRTLSDALLIAVFLAGIGLPFVGLFLQWDTRAVAGENRAIMPRPEFPDTLASLRQYPRGWEDWFNDRFGFRNSLVRWNYNVHFAMLGLESGNEVLVGKEGWLFYDHGTMIEDWQGRHPFSERSLMAWKYLLEQRRDWLASKGIRYLVVLVPEKSSIYPEYLPDDVRRDKRDSRLDQLVLHLRLYSTLEVVDTRPGLLVAKQNGRIWNKTDTHWNDEGAFVAYVQIAERLRKFFPEVRPLPRDEFEARVFEDHSALDLAGMLGVRDKLQEDRILLVRRTPALAHPTTLSPFLERKEWPPKRGPLVYVRDDDRGPRAVAIRDSFMTQIIPFLSEHFSRTVYLWHTWDTDVILDERPDVVIDEFVERRMSHGLANPPEVAAFRRR